MNSKFLIEYIKHPATIGAVAPSSKYLAEKMIENVDFENCSAIAEYGAGTGVFTAEVVKKLKKSTADFFVIEQDEYFYNILRKKFGKCHGVHIIYGDAQNLRKYMKKYGVDRVDYIISGLPFASLPHKISDKVLAETRKIIAENGGKFITFQYTLFKRKLFEHFFNIKNISVAFRNIPPAFVLTMTSKR